MYYDEGYSSAGRIFAIFPLAALLCSPLASLLCRRLGKGKLGVWQLGLLISVAATFSFGCSRSIASFYLFRGLQVRTVALCCSLHLLLLLLLLLSGLNQAARGIVRVERSSWRGSC